MIGVALVASIAACASTQKQSRPATPEAQGVESGALADAIDVAVKQNLPIHELLVARHGVTVLDLPFAPFPEASRHDIASVTKSITSLLIGAAVQAGALRDTNVTLAELFPLVDAEHGAIRVADLLGMQSGMDCGFKGGEAELRAMMASANWTDFALSLPMRSKPGTQMGYCSPGYHLLSAIITRVTGTSAADFARRVLFGPLGITDIYWPADPQGVTRGWGDLQMRAADLAKIGQLLLRGGEWNGKQIVSREWIKWSTTQHVQFRGNDYYAYGWWTHPDAPAGFYEAIGRGGQRLSILPSKELVVVITAGGFEPGALGGHLLKSVASDTTLRPQAEANARLARSVQAARTRVTESPSNYVAACADSLYAMKYKVEPNPLGIQSFTLRPGVFRLQLTDRSLDLPVRSDGRFETAKQPIDEILPMSRGVWKPPCEFVLELDLLGKVDFYTLAIKFQGETAEVQFSERTGLMRGSVQASAR
jgi:CubicO group peptidase (beta-lactamase class C family)